MRGDIRRSRGCARLVRARRLSPTWVVEYEIGYLVVAELRPAKRSIMVCCPAGHRVASRSSTLGIAVSCRGGSSGPRWPGW